MSIKKYRITRYCVYKEQFTTEIDTDDLEDETPQEAVKRLSDEGELSDRTFDGEFIDYLPPNDAAVEWTMEDIDKVEEIE